MRTIPAVVALLLAATTACGGDGESTDASTPASASGSESDAGGADAGSDPSVEVDEETDDGTGGSKTLSPEEQDARDRGAPGLPDAQGRQNDVLTRVPGNASAGCEPVGSRRDVRSGGFMAGPFDDVRTTWGTKREGFGRTEVRLYLVPRNAKAMPGVTLTATSGSQTVRITQDQVADAEQWRYYDVRIDLPERGRWILRATAGRDTGCFRVDL